LCLDRFRATEKAELLLRDWAVTAMRLLDQRRLLAVQRLLALLVQAEQWQRLREKLLLQWQRLREKLLLQWQRRHEQALLHE
jgi:hypothetical protein